MAKDQLDLLPVIASDWKERSNLGA